MHADPTPTQIREMWHTFQRYNQTRAISGRRDALVRSKFDYIDIGARTYSVPVGGDIQAALDKANAQEGGIVSLAPGTHSPGKTLTLPSNVVLEGLGSGSTIDFGDGAYQIQIVGSNAYSTGTASATNKSTAIVGTDTVWTSAMVGRSILIGDYWYEITAVADGTHLTIGSSYNGQTESGITFVIATVISGAEIRSLTIQNSSIALVKAQYVDDFTIVDCFLTDGLVAFDADDSALLNVLDGFISACTTGVTMDNSQFGTWSNTAIVGCLGDAFVMTKCRNWAIDIFSAESHVGRALAFTSCSNIGIENYTISECDGISVEFISGNSDITILDGRVVFGGSDGIKLTASSDGIKIVGGTISNNAGYGVNIAAATCDNNIIGLNVFSANSLGNLNDLGTATAKGLSPGI